MAANPRGVGIIIQRFTRQYMVWQEIVWYPNRPATHRGVDPPRETWRQVRTIGRVEAVGQTASGDIQAIVITKERRDLIRIPVRCIWEISTTGETYVSNAPEQRREIERARQDAAREEERERDRKEYERRYGEIFERRPWVPDEKARRKAERMAQRSQRWRAIKDEAKRRIRRDPKDPGGGTIE